MEIFFILNNLVFVRAIMEVKKYIVDRLRGNKIICMISIDIKNVFNSIKNKYLMNIFRKYDISKGNTKMFNFP